MFGFDDVILSCYLRPYLYSGWSIPDTPFVSSGRLSHKLIREKTGLLRTASTWRSRRQDVYRVSMVTVTTSDRQCSRSTPITSFPL